MAYFIVSWDVSAGQPTWGQVDERLRNCFNHLLWTKPVNTFYMVKTDSPVTYQQVLVNLQKAAESSPVEVRFIMSPLFTHDSYNGWLNRDEWPKVAAIAA